MDEAEENSQSKEGPRVKKPQEKSATNGEMGNKGKQRQPGENCISLGVRGLKTKDGSAKRTSNRRAILVTLGSGILGA